jgi:hypothetical protein
MKALPYGGRGAEMMNFVYMQWTKTTIDIFVKFQLLSKKNTIKLLI